MYFGYLLKVYKLKMCIVNSYKWVIYIFIIICNKRESIFLGFFKVYIVFDYGFLL